MLEITVILFVSGFIVGNVLESKHYRSIREREQETLNLPVSICKSYDKSRPVVQSKLVNGSTVVAIDYFKYFAGLIKSFFGGNVKAYETLIDRARREAILRMKEEAKGYDIIVNTRVETSSISGRSKKQKVVSIEAMAYGTALKYANNQ